MSLQELVIGAASRSNVARFRIDARRRDGMMTQCVGRVGLKQLPMPVEAGAPAVKSPLTCSERTLLPTRVHVPSHHGNLATTLISN